jgi:hypothetical protein
MKAKLLLMKQIPRQTHIFQHTRTLSLCLDRYNARDELVRVHPYIQLVSQFLGQIGLQLIYIYVSVLIEN